MPHPMPHPMPLHGLPDLALIRPGRMHEATGPGRRAFAAALAGRLEGPVLWVRESRVRDTLCPQGLAPFFDPARLVLARPTGARAVLQVAEEALRSGAAALVVAELMAAADLTASRRLQLAAGAGGGRGLCLLPEARTRPNAAETRWHCAPIPGPIPDPILGGHARQLWELVKNKRGRLGTWEVAWGEIAWREAAWREASGAAPEQDRSRVAPTTNAAQAAAPTTNAAQVLGNDRTHPARSGGASLDAGVPSPFRGFAGDPGPGGARQAPEKGQGGGTARPATACA